MSRPAQILGLLAALWLALVLALLTLFDIYGDVIMKRLARLAAFAALLLVAACTMGCTSFDPVKFAEAANKLDPGCGKLVDVRVGTNWFMGWPMPVVTGVYTKACHPEQLQAVPGGPAPAAPGGLVLGRPVG